MADINTEKIRFWYFPHKTYGYVFYYSNPNLFVGCVGHYGIYITIRCHNFGIIYKIMTNCIKKIQNFEMCSNSDMNFEKL